jgi:hypothetical protein
MRETSLRKTTGISSGCAEKNPNAGTNSKLAEQSFIRINPKMVDLQLHAKIRYVLLALIEDHQRDRRNTSGPAGYASRPQNVASDSSPEL